MNRSRCLLGCEPNYPCIEWESGYPSEGVFLARTHCDAAVREDSLTSSEILYRFGDAVYR